MQYLQLGKTDLRVSRICFGCWQLSPKFWGEVPQEEWEQAVQRALDLGVNFIDTADAYGDGMAETTLGNYLDKEKIRDRFILATKFYWNFYGEERHPDTRHDHIIRACEESLRRLKTDTIDLYQIHAWDPLTRPEEVAAAFARLKKEGKVRWFGVSNLNADQMRMYSRYLEVSCLQPPYSLLTRQNEAREFPFCRENQIGVIAYSPLYRGLLTGKYDRGHTFHDSRAEVGYFKGKAFQRLLDGLDELAPFCDKYGLTTAQLAIRWVLTHPAISCAIVGIKKPDHIDTIVPAADSLLANEDWHAIARIMTRAQSEADLLEA
jgi:aryl-alcohol dehydrogenase-like predicted oxidoreductase